MVFAAPREPLDCTLAETEIGGLLFEPRAGAALRDARSGEQPARPPCADHGFLNDQRGRDAPHGTRTDGRSASAFTPTTRVEPLTRLIDASSEPTRTVRS